MSGQNGAHDAAHDEATRLEAALDRIARAAAHAQHQAAAAAHEIGRRDIDRPEIGLRQDAPHATTQAETAPEAAELAARLDSLIADIRSVLGTQGM